MNKQQVYGIFEENEKQKTYILLERNETRFIYGVYYYGNARPKNIANMEEFSDCLEAGTIFQYYELQSLEELKEELRQR